MAKLQFIDWNMVMHQLSKAGVKPDEISKKIKVHVTTVASWRYTDRKPNFDSGFLLLELWAKVHNCTIFDAPKLKR